MGLLRRTLVASPLSRLGAEVATLVAIGYGALLSRRGAQPLDGLLIFKLPSWAYPRGGITIGRVFLTGQSCSESLLRHERVHVQQWRRYGLLFPLLYWAAGLDPRRNRFEVEAGLIDGGYAPADEPGCAR